MLSIFVVNVTALCQAITRPHLQDRFRELPGAVVVEGNGKASVNGIWVHLSLIIEQAEAMNVPKSLARVLLDENAINLVSRITPHRTEISSYPLCCSSRILPTPWLYSIQRNKAPRDLVHPSVTTPTQSIILPGTPQRTSQMPRSKKGMRTFRLDSASPLDVK